MRKTAKVLSLILEFSFKFQYFCNSFAIVFADQVKLAFPYHFCEQYFMVGILLSLFTKVKVIFLMCEKNRKKNLSLFAIVVFAHQVKPSFRVELVFCKQFLKADILLVGF